MNTNDRVTLEKYVDTRIEDLERARQQAYSAMEKRLEGMNEFRNTLRDQAGRFITKSDLKVIEADIRALRDFKSSLEGKADQRALTITTVVAVIGTVLSIISIIIAIIS